MISFRSASYEVQGGRQRAASAATGLIFDTHDVAGDEDGLEDVFFFELGFAGGFVKGEEACGAVGHGDAGGELGGEAIGEGELEAAALGVKEVLAVFEGIGGVELEVGGEFDGDAVRGDGGFEFDAEADGAGFLSEDGLTFFVDGDTGDEGMFAALVSGGRGS